MERNLIPDIGCNMNSDLIPEKIRNLRKSGENPSCSCCSMEEYENFLIGEYGAEKILEVKREEERYKKWLENLSDVEKIAILIAGFCGIPKDVLDKI